MSLSTSTLAEPQARAPRRPVARLVSEHPAQSMRPKSLQAAEVAAAEAMAVAEAARIDFRDHCARLRAKNAGALDAPAAAAEQAAEKAAAKLGEANRRLAVERKAHSEALLKSLDQTAEASTAALLRAAAMLEGEAEKILAVARDVERGSRVHSHKLFGAARTARAACRSVTIALR